MSTLVPNVFAFLGRGRFSPGMAPPHAQLPDFPLAGHLLLPVVIFAISFLTIDLAKMANLIATVWPSNAIMLAAMLCHGRGLRNFAAIILEGSAAMALAGALAGDSLALCAALPLANVVEVVIALLLLEIFRIGSANVTAFRGLFIFVVTAGGIAPIGSTVISAIAFGAENRFPWLAVWRNWYPSHALGMIIVVPFLISITSVEWRALRVKDRIPEAVAVLVVFVAVGLAASYFRFLIFLLAPAILFVTTRFGIVGATAATFATAIITSAFVVMGVGHPLLSQPELGDRIFALQSFLAITSFWALPTAALLTERDHLLSDLSSANSRLMAESEKTSHLVTGLRRHLSIVEEKERLRLTHECHEPAGQSLIAAILELNEIDSLIFGPARQRLHLVRKKMEDMGKTLHRIAWELRPPSIDELGLRKALASYIADWSEQCGTEVDFHCDDPKLDEVPNEIATALYRVVQEGLTNIVKHAQRPSDVSVVIRRQDATLQLIIEDNGCGFDVGALSAKTGNHKIGNHRGLGLDGMRERLSLIGGTLEVESAIGAGTTIFARIAQDGQK
jgi:signal transduction histidine kinase